MKVIDPEAQVLNTFKISRRVYLWLAECVNAIDDLLEIESDATDIERLEGDRAGCRVTMFSSRFQYEILCDHAYCSLQLALTPLEGGKPQIIFSGDCRLEESWLRVRAYVLVAEQYKLEGEEDAIKRILIAAFGQEIFKNHEQESDDDD